MFRTATVEEETIPKDEADARAARGALSLMMLLASLGTSIANISLPTLEHSFGASFAQVQWVVLAYLVAVTSVIVGAGRVGDLFGRRRIVLMGIAVFTGASVLSGFASTLGILIAGRAIQGMGAAVMMALSMAFVSDVWPRERMGRAMGILGTMSAVGTAIGPSLGGLLIGMAGWRAVFLVNVPLGLVALFLAARHLPVHDRPRREAAAFDGVGMLLLVITLAAYAVAMTTGRGEISLANVGFLVVAFIGAVGFSNVERRVRSPLIDSELIWDPRFRGRLLTSGIVSAVVMTTLVVGPFYLTGVMDLKVATVGWVLSIGPAVAALAGMPAGRWVEKAGAGLVTMVGLSGVAAGSVALAFMPASAGVAGYVGAIVVLTFGYACFQTANNTAVMEGIPATRRGVISGILNLSRNLGLVTGASFMTAIFAFASGKAGGNASPVGVAAGMHVTFAAAAVLALVAMAIAWREQRRINAAANLSL